MERESRKRKPTPEPLEKEHGLKKKSKSAAPEESKSNREGAKILLGLAEHGLKKKSNSAAPEESKSNPEGASNVASAKMLLGLAKTLIGTGCSVCHTIKPNLIRFEASIRCTDCLVSGELARIDITKPIKVK
jgi:hypothetical protein